MLTKDDRKNISKSLVLQICFIARLSSYDLTPER